MARNPMATSLESKARRTNEAPESSIDEGHLDLTVPECCKQVLEPPTTHGSIRTGRPYYILAGSWLTFHNFLSFHILEAHSEAAAMLSQPFRRWSAGLTLTA